MAADPDKLADAFQALLSFLSEKLPNEPALDDIAVMLDNGIDATGMPTSAMDRMIRRRATKPRVVTAEDAADRDKRFPNAGRLVRTV